MRFLPVNLNSLLVELADLDETLALLASVQAEPVAGVTEVVPAARTLLVDFCPLSTSAAQIAQTLRSRTLGCGVRADGKLVHIPVHYDGEDLAWVAEHLQVSPAALIAMHTESLYRVAFCGFAPGFAYLSGNNPRFNVPRRSTPRTKVPAGAVSLAGAFSGIYPKDSPGGWQIIGTTPLKMWDLQRAEAALLQPGYCVQFVDAKDSERMTSLGLSPDAQAPVPNTADQTAPDAPAPYAVAGHGPWLEVVQAGLQSCLQDLGRRGLVGQGVSASGALDQSALKAANRLVGNPSDAAALELVYGGLQLRSHGRSVLAVTGAQTPLTVTTAQGQTLAATPYESLSLNDGDVLAIGQPTAGIRSYVAVRGGYDVPAVLGSWSTDTLADVGPPVLKAGMALGIGGAGPLQAAAQEAGGAFALPTSTDVVVLDVVMGPRTDWFTPEAVALLQTQEWQVTAQSNRIGIRLLGEQPLTRSQPAELPSEGTSVGAIQVPASGQPVLFLADHPLTGGYPVIGVVAPYHLDLAGQTPVGARIRFNPIAPFADIE